VSIIFFKRIFFKLNLLKTGQINLIDLFQEVKSYLINFFPFQRQLRKKRFIIRNISYRRVIKEDFNAFKKFLCDYSASYRKSFLSKENNNPFYKWDNIDSEKDILYGIFLEDNLLGIVRLQNLFGKNGFNFWLISGLNIAKRYRGLGLGEGLIYFILSKFKSDKQILFLTVGRANYRAVNLYKKVGFVPKEDSKIDSKLLQLVPDDTKTSIVLINNNY